MRWLLRWLFKLRCATAQVDDANGMVQSAILLSFVFNFLLLCMKMWLAILTGSMSIIASTADSVLDLLSGVVLLMTERAAHKDVDHYQYPEGRGRIEPIGIIIFATVMCLSSANILIGTFALCQHLKVFSSV